MYRTNGRCVKSLQVSPGLEVGKLITYGGCTRPCQREVLTRQRGAAVGWACWHAGGRLCSCQILVASLTMVVGIPLSPGAAGAQDRQARDRGPPRKSVLFAAAPYGNPVTDLR
jgi:hypothetical protein